MYKPMFIHNPKNLLIGCKQRCGHTMMFTRFNIPINSYIGGVDEWIQMDPGVQKTMVLRHPIERMWSAVGWYDNIFGAAIKAYDSSLDTKGVDVATQAAIDAFEARYSVVPEEKKKFYQLSLEESTRLVKQFVAVSPAARRLSMQTLVYGHHCDPYMDKLLDVDFKYIPFENLEDYLGTERVGVILNESNRSIDGFEINNTFFTQQELMNEVEHYEYLIKNKQKLTLDEWFELTL